MEVEAAVSNTLPMSVLFETDNPELTELLEGGMPDRLKGESSQKIEEALAVTKSTE